MDKTIVSLLSSSDDNNEGETPRMGQMMTLVCAVIYNVVQRSLDILHKNTAKDLSKEDLGHLLILNEVLNVSRNLL